MGYPWLWMALLTHPSRITSVLVSEESGREEELEGPWGQGALLATSGQQGGIRTCTEPDRSGHLARLSWICSLGYLFSQLAYICGLLAVCSSIWGAGATDSLGQTCSLSKWQYREAQALVQQQLSPRMSWAR